MQLGDIEVMVMFQTNNDADDLGDFQPYVISYINDAYYRLIEAYHKAKMDTEEFPRLINFDDAPKLPEWMHQALADWATWMVYRNGNPQKQYRGQQFKTSFEEVLRKVLSSGGKAGEGRTVRTFYNLP